MGGSTRRAHEHSPQLWAGIRIEAGWVWLWEQDWHCLLSRSIRQNVRGAHPEHGAINPTESGRAGDKTISARTTRSLITGDDGQIREDREEGLVVYQTRTLSRFIVYFIDGKQPRPAGLSAVQENSWLGYYIAPAPGESSDTQRTIELRAARFIGNGLHEEIDLTNYTQKTVELTLLAIEVDADFVDQSEMGKGKDTAQGSITRAWQRKDDKWELYFDFHAEHSNT